MSILETAETLADLHRAAFAELGERPWTTPEFASLLTTPGIRFGIREQGFVAVRVAADEAEILTLAVHPEARRQGLGRALVEQALAEVTAAGAARVLLEVAVDNAAARGLYDSLGFVEAGRRGRYYGRADGSRVDALVLTLDLSPPTASAGSPAA